MNDFSLSEDVIFHRAYGQSRRDKNMLRTLREHRESIGLSIEQVAKVMGVEPSQVSSFESGSWNAHQRFCREYAVAIGIEIHYTFKESENE